MVGTARVGIGVESVGFVPGACHGDEVVDGGDRVLVVVVYRYLREFYRTEHVAGCDVGDDAFGALDFFFLEMVVEWCVVINLMVDDVEVHGSCCLLLCLECFFEFSAVGGGDSVDFHMFLSFCCLR